MQLPISQAKGPPEFASPEFVVFTHNISYNNAALPEFAPETEKRSLHMHRQRKLEASP